MNEQMIERVAKRILAEVKVEYTQPNSPAHNFRFKGGKDVIRLYHNPKLVKPFTAVISGKDWDEPGSQAKTLVTFNDKGMTSLRSGKEDSTLGRPAIFSSLPINLKHVVFNVLNGRYDEA